MLPERSPASAERPPGRQDLPASPQPDARLGRRLAPGLVVWGATVAYTFVASYFSLEKHENFLSAFDLANFDQALWLLAQGEEPFITQHGRHLLGDHFDPTLLLLTPIYVFGGGPGALLILQSALIGLVAPLLFKLAVLRGAMPWLAVLPAILWLISPLTLVQNIDDFHHIPVAAPLIVGSVVALQQSRLWLFALTGLLACGLKEDIPLIYLMLGVIVFLEGRRRLGVAIGASAVAVFAFAAFVFMPHYSDSLDWFAKRFAGSRGESVPDVAAWIIQHPIAAIEDLMTWQNAFVVLALLATSGGLFLLAPKWSLLALPAFAHNMLTVLPEQHMLRYHYWFPVILGLAIAGAVGVAKLPRVRLDLRPLVVAAVCISFWLFPVGLAYADFSANDVWKGGAEPRAQAVAIVPRDASVAASVRLTPHLSQRREIYTLPLPFLFADYGGDLSAADFRERARRVDYVVLDLVDTPKELRATPQLLPPLLKRLGFHVVFRRSSIVVFERTTARG